MRCCAVTEANQAALLIEVDGALCDVHQDGHRQAFNRAFNDLGYYCTSWSIQVYHDLLSQGDGTGESLVAAYYATVGWPTFLPTSEQGLFAHKVHQLKRRIFWDMLRAGQVPLRTDATLVIDQALAAGARVGLVSETLSEPADDVAGSMLALLGAERAPQLQVFSASLHVRPGSVDEEEDAGTGEDGGSLEASVAAAAARMKQQGAAAFMQQLQREAARNGVSTVGLAAHLQAGFAHTPAMAPAFLAAVAQLLQVPAARCVMLAANGATVRAAAGAGMVAVAVPRRLAAAASFPEARCKFEQYGPGYCSWGRLASLLPAAMPAASGPS